MPDSGQGWRAECRDCKPLGIGDYGETLYVAYECGDSNPELVEMWAVLHAQERGHKVTVSRFMRWSLSCDSINQEALRTVFGPAWPDDGSGK